MSEIPNGWAVYRDGALVFSVDSDKWRAIGPAIAAIMEEPAHPWPVISVGRRTPEREPGLRKIKVRVTGMGRPKTLTYQTAQDVELNQEVQVPRWPGMPKGEPLRGTVVALTSDREGPLVTIIGG